MSNFHFVPADDQMFLGTSKFSGACIIDSPEDKRTRIENRKCTHQSHQAHRPASDYDFSTLYPSSILLHNATNSIHGNIPYTPDTYNFILLVINGTIALHMIRLDPIELYDEILKHMVPLCYNIKNLIDNIFRSIIRVKNPMYTATMKQRQIMKGAEIHSVSHSRMATLADFGLIESSKVPKKGKIKNKR